MAPCLIPPLNGVSSNDVMPGGDPSRPLAAAQIAFIESADRITVAGPGARGRPALFACSGPPGMLKLVDGRTIATALHDGKLGSVRPIASGCACSGLLTRTTSSESLRIAGTLRWLSMFDTARVVRRALGGDRRSFDTCSVLLFEVEE